MDQGLVEITFELKDFKPIDGCIPVITGNIVELGEWKPDCAVKAEYVRFQKLDGMPLNRTWIAKTMIPANIQYDWNWAVVSADNKFIAIEENIHKRYNAGYFDKFYSQSWDQDDHDFSTIKMSKITIKTKYHTEDRNHKLAVIGSHPALGCWTPEKYIPGKQFPRKSGSWQVDLMVPKRVSISWKWIVVNVKTYEIIRWEERRNRILFVSTDYVLVEAPWNSPEEAQILSTEDPYTDYLFYHPYPFPRDCLVEPVNPFKKNRQKDSPCSDIISNLFETILDSKLPHEYRYTTHKFDKKPIKTSDKSATMSDKLGTGHLLNGDLHFADVTGYHIDEDVAIPFIVTEDKDGNISIHIEPNDRFRPDESDVLCSSVGAPYYDNCLLMSEILEGRQKKRVVQKIEEDTSRYNKDEGSMLTKSLLDAKKMLLFKLCLNKTIKKLPTGAMEYYADFPQIKTTKEHAKLPDKVLTKLKSKKIIAKIENDQISGCAKFSFYANRNSSAIVFKESSVDVPFSYGGIVDDISTWKICDLTQTNVDTGLEEDYILTDQLRILWYNYMCSLGTFRLII